MALPEASRASAVAGGSLVVGSGAVVASEELFTASDGEEIFVRTWTPLAGVAPRAVVHMHHGLGDHSGRYAELAERLVQAGFVVVSHDARGHGQTSQVEDALDLGCIECGDEGAVQRMVDDFTELLRKTHSERPSLPVFLLGHSYGTVVSQLCAAAGAGGVPLRGLVFSAPPARVLDVQVAAFTVLVAGLHAIHGEHGTSKIINMLTSDKWNAQTLKAIGFEGEPTGWEWLNRDAKQRQLFVDDPLTGQDLSMGFWRSALSAQRKLADPAAYDAMPATLPICILEGSTDFCAVNDFGTRAHASIEQELVRAGKAAPKVIIYPEAHHELLHELNRQEVFSDVERFLTDCLASAPPSAAPSRKARRRARCCT